MFLLQLAPPAALRRQSATFVIENPPDRGQPESHLFRWTARQHAPLWLTPCMQSLAAVTKAIMLTFPQCALGSDFQKWTSLMAAGPRAQQLQALGTLTCSHVGKHIRVAEGRDAQGKSNAAASGAYPIGMAAFVIWALARPDVRQALEPGSLPLSCVWPTVGTALDGVRMSMRRQEELNARAVAAFYGETRADIECTDCALEVAPAALGVEQVSPVRPAFRLARPARLARPVPIPHRPAGDPAAAARLLAIGPVQVTTAASGAGTVVAALPAGGWRYTQHTHTTATAHYHPTPLRGPPSP